MPSNGDPEAVWVIVNPGMTKADMSVPIAEQNLHSLRDWISDETFAVGPDDAIRVPVRARSARVLV